MRSRNKILHATVALIGEVGFEGVTIAGAAHTAGVSRQTVYSIFGSREELVSQAVAGVAVEALAGIHTCLRHIETPADYVVELIVASRTVVRDNAILGALLRSERENPVFDNGMVARAKPVARTLFAPLVARHPEVESQLEDIIEISLFLGLSVVLFDDEAVHSDDELRRFLTRWLGPALSHTRPEAGPGS
ncbi:TetR/AcrR family transcriptional regulator [Rhodococcus sp. NPDC058639]|uniref:TetR/AcrR family transcriptional regulator n=1 Tax=Rhodococcus sp. NPDC058639 TaxID=3346570 RepID=UPI00366998E4